MDRAKCQQIPIAVNDVSTHGPPRVTVFTPVYNREHTLRATIESVLAQTYRDFELLLIDDGSKDASLEVIRSYTDPRIRLVAHEQNQGIPKTRNHGLELARGQFLAILDSDDIANRTRLAHQVEFLDRHPDIAAVGSWLTRIDARGRPRGFIARPTHPDDVRAHILFVSCFKNPAMMARTEVVRRFGYREEFVYCQDIDLWGRISEQHRLANLPRFLTRYRMGGESRRDEALAFRLKMLAAREMLAALGVRFDDADLARHVLLRNTAYLEPDTEFLDWLEDWLMRILEQNKRRQTYPEPHLTFAATERWLLVAARAVACRSVPLRRILRAPLRRHAAGCLAHQATRALRDAPPALVSLVR
jgi:glycosyltransferase involved in cell wall biosynthesis